MSSRSVILSTSMLVARTHPTAAEAESDRPAFHYVYKPADVQAAATAVPPPSPEYSAAIAAHAARPPVISEQALHPMCFAYARLTAPNRNPGRVIYETILEAALDLIWGLVALLPSAHGTMVLRFPTPAHREDAMRLQPFGYAGGAVTLVRAWDTSILDDYLIHKNPQHLVRSPDDLLVHVALHRYPAEQRTERDIGANCRGFGWVLEVDRACFAAPDLAPVHVVLCVGHPREIPRELRVVYGANGSTSVVPVQILGVFDWPAAFGAHGRYVRFFQQNQAAPAPADLLGSRMQAISLS